MKRPPIPVEAKCSLKPAFQFPKSLIQPCLVPWIWLVDQGFLGANQLETHVVMTGFPRSGTTLAQLMAEACVSDLKAYGKERRALEIARYGSRASRFLLTKRPRDLFLLDDIWGYYENRGTKVKFILFLRDPRDILTSQHVDQPGQYYISAIRWKTIHEYWKLAIEQHDVIVVKYEEMVANPSEIEQKLTEFVGWNVVHPFEDFHKHVPKGFDVDALNGVRKLDSKNSQRWRKHCYFNRICELLQDRELDLPSRLVQLGYEEDDLWVKEYLNGRTLPASEAA